MCIVSADDDFRRTRTVGCFSNARGLSFPARVCRDRLPRGIAPGWIVETLSESMWQQQLATRPPNPLHALHNSRALICVPPWHSFVRSFARYPPMRPTRRSVDPPPASVFGWLPLVSEPAIVWCAQMDAPLFALCASMEQPHCGSSFFCPQMCDDRPKYRDQSRRRGTGAV